MMKRPTLKSEVVSALVLAVTIRCEFAEICLAAGDVGSARRWCAKARHWLARAEALAGQKRSR